MTGKIYEAKTADGRRVYRTGVTGPLTFKQTEFVYEFVLGCSFTTIERAEQCLSQFLKQSIKATPTDRTGEYFYL